MSVAGGGLDGSTQVFEDARDRLFGIAYRMTGSVMTAEDIVQEAWLRWSGADRGSVRNPDAWLTTVTTRLSIDHLRSAQHQRETYVGPWLPEPLVVENGPATAAEMSETLTLGFLTVLDRLEPVERAVFLLHEVFGVPFAEVASIVERTEATCRQIARRARERVRRERSVTPVSPERQRELVGAFLQAVAAGDLGTLTQVLAEDAVWVSDAGAERRAARFPVHGRDRVARFVMKTVKRVPPDLHMELIRANEELALLATEPSGEPWMLLVFECGSDGITGLWSVMNPDKLESLGSAG